MWGQSFSSCSGSCLTTIRTSRKQVQSMTNGLCGVSLSVNLKVSMYLTRVYLDISFWNPTFSLPLDSKSKGIMSHSVQLLSQTLFLNLHTPTFVTALCAQQCNTLNGTVQKCALLSPFYDTLGLMQLCSLHFFLYFLHFLLGKKK